MNFLEALQTLKAILAVLNLILFILCAALVVGLGGLLYSVGRKKA